MACTVEGTVTADSPIFEGLNGDVAFDGDG